MPAPLRRSMPPIQSSRSGLTGFFTSTGTSMPFKASARACIAKGLATVRAPIQRISTSAASAASTCCGVATSVATSMPVSFFTRVSHGSPASPTPSKPPGLVRGFQMPARKMRTPLPASWHAVLITCSSVSAEQGPAMIIGRCVSMPGSDKGVIFSSIFLRFL